MQAGMRLALPFNPKARLWVLGRLHWKAKLKRQMREKDFAKFKTVIWMHASSLGEFEQGRPLLEAIRQRHPNAGIILTFFSPSGYEVRKNFSGADIVCYLPADTAYNAKRFVSLVKPTLALWVKYEYWYHHLHILYKQNIPIVLVSGIFWPQSVFFKWYGKLHKKMLPFFTHFFVQNEASANLLSQLVKQDKITVSGDTRFDRVTDIVDNWKPVEPVEKWLQGATKVVVAGSTWPSDEEELVHFFKTNPTVKLIVAPHQMAPNTLKETIELFKDATLLSDWVQEENHLPGAKNQVLIINNIGTLSRLYHYGHICYVGGGFTGNGIHNVLEAAVYGKPVIHGPEYEKFSEAIGLEEAGGSFPVENALDLEKKLSQLFSDSDMYNKSAAAAKDFVFSRKGGTQIVLDGIYKNRLLINL